MADTLQLGENLAAYLESLSLDPAARHPFLFLFRFDRQGNAERFAGKLAPRGYACEVMPEDGAGVWLCQAVRPMALDIDAMNLEGERLIGLAEKYEGEFCSFALPVPDHNACARTLQAALRVQAALELYEDGELEQADEIFEESFGQDHDCDELIATQRGLIALKQGRNIDAIRWLREALHLIKDGSENAEFLQEVRLNLGVAFTNTHQFNEAAKWYERVLLDDPDCSAAYYNLACTYAQAKQPEACAARLQRAVQLDRHWLRSAMNDPDFDPVRASPAFQGLLAMFKKKR